MSISCTDIHHYSQHRRLTSILRLLSINTTPPDPWLSHPDRPPHALRVTALLPDVLHRMHSGKVFGACRPTHEHWHCTGAATLQGPNILLAMRSVTGSGSGHFGHLCLPRAREGL